MLYDTVSSILKDHKSLFDVVFRLKKLTKGGAEALTSSVMLACGYVDASLGAIKVKLSVLSSLAREAGRASGDMCLERRPFC